MIDMIVAVGEVVVHRTSWLQVMHSTGRDRTLEKAWGGRICSQRQQNVYQVSLLLRR